MSQTLAIDDVVSAAAEKAGLSPDQARKALIAALGLLDRHGETGAVEAVYEAVPGARDLARSDEARAPRAGLFGGLMQSAGGVSGKAIGEAMAVLGGLEKIGVDRDALKRLLPAARNVIRTATGRDLLGDAVKTLPGVGALLGQ